MQSPASLLAGSTDLLQHQPKAQRACARMEEMAHQMGAEAKFPRVSDLCESLNVSPVTLTKALDELERRGVIYRVQGRGIFVAAGLRRSILLICDPSFLRGSNHSPFWDLLMVCAGERAHSEREEISYHLTLPLRGDDAPLHQGLVRQIAAGGVAGVLGVGLHLQAALWIEQQGVPFVALAGPAQHRVGFNALEFTRHCVRALAKQGCRRIGLWSEVAPYRPHTQSSLSGAQDLRLHYFQTALQEVGLSFQAELVQNNHHLIAQDDEPTDVSAQEQGFQTAKRALCQPDEAARPDGIVILNDMVTQGALAAFDSLQVRPGRDLAIASHATTGSAVLMGREAELTLFEYDPSEVAQAMFEVLELLMDGKPAPPEVLLVPRSRASPVSGKNQVEPASANWF